MSPLLVDKSWENAIIEGNSEKLPCIHSLFGPLCESCIQSKTIYDTTNKQTSVFKLAFFFVSSFVPLDIKKKSDCVVAYDKYI